MRSDDYLMGILTLIDVSILKLNKMNTTKFHQLVTKIGIKSLAALSAIGILATFFGVCQIDLDFLPDFFAMIFLFILSTLSILVCFCFPVSFLMTLVSIAASLKKYPKNVEAQE